MPCVLGVLCADSALLQQTNQIRGAVEALGRRHVGYGVRDEHYSTLGEALLWTLEQGLAFTMQRAAATSTMALAGAAR